MEHTPVEQNRQAAPVEQTTRPTVPPMDQNNGNDGAYTCQTEQTGCTSGTDHQTNCTTNGPEQRQRWTNAHTTTRPPDHQTIRPPDHQTNCTSGPDQTGCTSEPDQQTNCTTNGTEQRQRWTNAHTTNRPPDQLYHQWTRTPEQLHHQWNRPPEQLKRWIKQKIIIRFGKKVLDTNTPIFQQS